MITETLFFKVPVTSANASHQHCASNLRARISSRTAEYRKQFQIQLKSCIFIVTTFLLLSLFSSVCRCQRTPSGVPPSGAHPSGKIVVGSLPLKGFRRALKALFNGFDLESRRQNLPETQGDGGPDRTRTCDPALIKRML